MYNYRWFLVELVSLLSLFASAITVLVKRREIAATTTLASLPLKTLFYMAVLDTVHAMCLMLAFGVLPGPLAMLLPQLSVPIVLLFRFFNGGTQTYSLLCFIIR